MPSLVSGEALRVLLVSAAEDLREEVAAALAERAGDHRLYWVTQPDLAPLRAQDLLPHVILVDDEVESAGPVGLIAQLVARVPSSAILALVRADSMAVAGQAVLAGARGFVTKPVDTEQLLASLRQVLGQRQAPAAASESGEGAGRIVVFCAPKGGTGRTTLAINTGAALQASVKGGVVLVDADYSAPALDVALNLLSEHTIADLLPRIGRLDEPLVNSVLATHTSGLRALLAPPPDAGANTITLPQVQRVLVWLRRMFSWVVVDLGLPMDETAFAFLDGADRIVMSVLPEMIGLRNTRLMLDQMLHRGYPEEKIWLALNRSTLAAGVAPKDIEERLRVNIRYRIPDDQALATYSINRGVPVVISHSQSALARAFRGFAAALAADGQAEPAAGEAAAPGGGLLGRLRRANPAGM